MCFCFDDYFFLNFYFLLLLIFVKEKHFIIKLVFISFLYSIFLNFVNKSRCREICFSTMNGFRVINMIQSILSQEVQNYFSLAPTTSHICVHLNRWRGNKLKSCTFYLITVDFYSANFFDTRLISIGYRRYSCSAFDYEVDIL